MPSITCYGATNLDRTARCLDELVLRSSNPVRVRQAAGGVARNVATNLAHLGNTVALLTVVGADAGGDELLRSLAADGIETGETLRREDRPTASYTAILDHDGELLIGLADMAIYDDVDRATLGVYGCNQNSDAWFIDANLSDDCLDALFSAGSTTTIAASTVSTPKASRLAGYLDRIDILFANRAEAAVLADHDIQSNDDALIAANRLHHKGVGTVFVTLGPRGAAVADSSAQSILPAIPSAARDVVGAGDAFAAGALAALLGSASLEDAMLSGLATASLTVEVDGPTDPKLNKLRVQERMRHRVS